MMVIIVVLLLSLTSISSATAISSTTRSSSLSNISRQNNVDLNSGFNHRAHAVPGDHYVSYDHDKSGSASVILNGARSHSHYSNPATGELGTIVKYVWVITTQNNRVVCQKQVCDRLFLKLGKHTVKLTVTDSTGDVASSTTTVSMLDAGMPGVRFLYYMNVQWIQNVYNKATSLKSPWSQTMPNIARWNSDQFPTRALKPGQYLSMRIYAELDVETEGEYFLRLDCGSIATCSMIIDGEAVINSKPGVNSVYKALESRPYKLHIIWRYLVKFDAAKHRQQTKVILQWMVPGSNKFAVIPSKYLSHSPGNIQPVVHELLPAEVRPDSKLILRGSSFEPNARVRIGNNDCKGLTYKSQFEISCIVDADPGTTQPLVVITPYGGKSNLRYLKILTSGASSPKVPQNPSGNDNKNTIFGVGYERRINFRNLLLQKNGREWRIKQPTAVIRGPDDRYYFARRDGSIVVTEITNGNAVREICTSRSLGRRAVLGLAFNPADKVFKMYASSSILDFKKRGISVAEGWKNGEIIVFVKKGNCVEKAPNPIITGLPVSAFDHSVNKLTFDNNGVLYFTVGSSTNAGIKSRETEDLEDSRLSATVLSAPVMKPGFNGRITYSNGGRPGTAIKTGGNVNVYATGVRNSFGIIYHSSGSIYATDNGGNQAYGLKSTGCNSQTRASNEADKLLKLRKGGFYGSANRARGGRECVHYSANSNPNKKTPGNYDKYLTTMEAATTGILEYTANTFGGIMRQNLMLGQIAPGGSNGKVYRVKLNKNTGNVDVIFTLNQWSGADIAMSGEGNLIMPRVYQSKVAVLQAVESPPNGKMVVTSVWPWRGPRSGGNVVHVTGWNLNFGTKVYFGGKECRDVKIVGANGRKLTCTTPGGSGKVPVNAKRNGQSSGSNGFEYMYMNI